MNTVKHILTCAGLALVVTSCTSNLAPSSGSSQSVSAAPGSMSSGERAVAQRVFSLVNAKRANAGKVSLKGHPGLISIAQKQSEMLSRGHEVNSTGVRNRSEYAYLRHSVENLSELTYRAPAGTSDPASKAVAAWSQGHGKKGHFMHAWHVIGVGAKKASDGSTYITASVGAQPSGVPRSVRPIGW